MFQRPTSLAAAFVNAACAVPGVDPDKGTGNWVARRSIINTRRQGFGVVCEFDHRPGYKPTAPVQQHPRVPRNLTETHEAINSFKADALKLAPLVDQLADVFLDVHTTLRAGRAVGLEDEEVLGVD